MIVRNTAILDGSAILRISSSFAEDNRRAAVRICFSPNRYQTGSNALLTKGVRVNASATVPNNLVCLSENFPHDDVHWI